MRRSALLVVAVLFAALSGVQARAEPPGRVLVFAAASLRNAVDAVAAQYAKTTGRKVVASYAASSTLAKQIANGAPADIYISADLSWMDYLAKRHAIKPKTRVDLLGNSLVLVAPTASKVAVTIAPGFPLAKLLHGGRLAIADPTVVPAGKYGKAALEHLGVWASVKDRLAPAENVRAALLLVARDEAPLGIVYKTDAAIEPAVKIVGVFPQDSHPPIIYPMALTAATANPDGAKFAAYLRSPAAHSIFEKEGFTVLGAAGRPS